MNNLLIYHGLVGGGVIEEITQKITVTKIEQEVDNRLQLLEILGSVE